MAKTLKETKAPAKKAAVKKAAVKKEAAKKETVKETKHKELEQCEVTINGKKIIVPPFIAINLEDNK